MWQLMALGLMMLILVFLLVVIRWYVQTNPQCTELKCPECGNLLDRCRRQYSDYLMSLWIPVRRYQCHYPGCRWTGWRVKPKIAGNNR